MSISKNSPNYNLFVMHGNRGRTMKPNSLYMFPYILMEKKCMELNMEVYDLSNETQSEKVKNVLESTVLSDFEKERT
jgi:hypothetical protein